MTTDIIERIEYHPPQIFLFQLHDLAVYLADFTFVDDDNKEYMMCTRYKGYGGAWFVFRDCVTNILYASNNVWYDHRDKQSCASPILCNNFVLVDSEIYQADFDKKYLDQNVHKLNNLSYVRDDMIDQIKCNCKKYIVEKHNQDLIHANTKLLFSCSNQGDTFYLTVRSKPKNHTDLKKLVYDLDVSDSAGGLYDNIEDVYKQLSDWVNIYYNKSDRFFDNYSNMLTHYKEKKSPEHLILFKNIIKIAKLCDFWLFTDDTYDNNKEFAKNYQTYFIMPYNNIYQTHFRNSSMKPMAC